MNKVHTSLLGAGAGLALALATTAANADGYRPGSVKDAAPCCDSWKGFYLGIHGGYGWKDNDFSNVISVAPPVSVGGIEFKGWLWGVHAGYNWQYGPVVTGLEIDLSQSNISGNSAPGVIPIGGGASITQIQGDDVKYLGSARARLGFTPGGRGGCCSNFLVYGTAGLAWERVDQTTSLTTVVPPFQVTTNNRQPTDWFGWVAGVGAEARLGGSNWIGRIEYLHYDFGSVQPSNSLITNIPGAVNFSDKAGSQTIEVVRAAISYKF